MQPTLIILYGYTGAGKSTIGELLSNNLTKIEKNNIVLKTNIARMQGREKFNPGKDYFDDHIEENRKDRDKSYKIIIDLSKEYLLKNKIVILDASFNKKYRRDWVYDLVDEIKANLIIIWCECKNKVKIKERIKKRYGDFLNPDNQANSFKVYSLVKNQADKIENLELKENKYKIIHFDTDLEKIEFFNCNESDELVALIKKTCEDVINQKTNKL